MPRNFRPYAEYRDVSVESLGKVPTRWLVCPLMHVVDSSRPVMYGIVLPGPDVPIGVPIVKGGDVKPGRLKINQLKKTSFEIEKKYGRSRLKTGDLVYAIRGGVGDVELVPAEIEGANLTQDAARISPAKGILASWLLMSLRGGYFWQQIERRVVGATVRGINICDLKRGIVAVPPPEEQAQIAKFLDYETAKIDALIEKQQQLIALLQEKRQAVISHAVAKGLNPDVPMRDSGAEWLGDVPAHWELSQLKYLVKPGTSITYGIVQAGPHIEDGVPYIKTSDMSGSELPTSGYSKTSKTIDESYSRSRVFPGDIVISIRASVGKCLPVPKQLPVANLTQGTAKISPGIKVQRDFLLAYIGASPVQDYLFSKAKGATFREITLDMLRRVPALVPPMDEQNNICATVREATEKYDCLATAAATQTELLQERRDALISAAVTGKIDVRNWTPPESEPEEDAP